jgi:hypothetical protein
VDVKWMSHSQPQTLQTGVMLIYVLAAMNVISALLFGGGGLFLILLVAGSLLGAVGIANDSKAGYRVAIAFTILPLLFLVALMIWYHVAAFPTITELMEIALACLLLHPQSREYVRIWFR